MPVTKRSIGGSRHILYVWELGENFGHMSAFVDVAKALVKQGHKVTLALQDVTRANRFFDLDAITVVQSPLVPRNPEMYKRVAAVTFADLIRNFGYMEPERLANALRAWRNLYALVKPDIVIFNAAPTAQLAARGLNFKRAALDTGFAMPPQTIPLPSLRPWDKIPVQEIARREKEVLDNINAALKVLKIPQMRVLGELFLSNRELLCTFRELDHYGWIRNEKAPYLGASFMADNGLDAVWPEPKSKKIKIFAYVRPKHPQFVNLVNALLAYTNAQVIMVAPGLRADVLAKLEKSHIKVYTQQVKIQPVLESAHFVIHHGGHGTAAACMLAGKPMILLPNHLEQLLVTRNMLQAGIALMPKPSVKDPNYHKMFDDILRQPAYLEHAQALAKKYKSFNKAAQAKALVAAIEETLEAPVSKVPAVKTINSVVQKKAPAKKQVKPVKSAKSVKSPKKKKK